LKNKGTISLNYQNGRRYGNYGSEISLNTIRAYIEHLKDVFIISEANRYDVKGRNTSHGKRYL
jgi:predicted AAA+ superfamily ATPase